MNRVRMAAASPDFLGSAIISPKRTPQRFPTHPLATGLVGHFGPPTGNGDALALDDGKTARTGAQYGNPAVPTLMCSKPGDIGVGFQLDRRKARKFRKQAIGSGFQAGAR